MSQQNSFLSEILGSETIPIGGLAYFRSRLSNRIHELVLEEFVRLEKDGKITRAKLARRIGRAPEQITRWLGSSGNWTMDTLSDLMLGMGLEPGLSSINLAAATQPQDATNQTGARLYVVADSKAHKSLRQVDEQFLETVQGVVATGNTNKRSVGVANG